MNHRRTRIPVGLADAGLGLPGAVPAAGLAHGARRGRDRLRPEVRA